MKNFLSTLAVLICLFVAGCASIPKDTIYQTSTIDALLAGGYDGNLTLDQLMKHGDFGLGTFDHLDGEMIILDGNIYQVKADGKVYKPALSNKTPFAAVCEFTPDKTIPVKEGTDYKSLEELIDKNIPSKNLFYAIKITGKFDSMKTRSVPRQVKPYPPLNEATSKQSVFNMEKISGTIVGFRCPPYVKGINVPGYHLHFISSDHTRGGHILNFEMSEGLCEIDILDRFYLKLPVNAEDFAKTDLSKDRTKELQGVEK